MRKVYVLTGWTPNDGFYISGIFSAMRKAEKSKAFLEGARPEVMYRIETEILL